MNQLGIFPIAVLIRKERARWGEATGEENNMCMRISIVKWCSLTRAFHLNQLLWRERTEQRQFVVFLPLKSSRVSKLKQETTVIYTCQIALPVMLQSTFLWRVCTSISVFNTHNMCWMGRKDHMVLFCKKTNFSNVPNNKKVDFLGETPPRV